jgi:anti-anti-sigma factor
MPFDMIPTFNMAAACARTIDGGDFRVTVSVRRDSASQTTVSLHGELGATTTGDVMDELISQIEAGVSSIVVELEHLTWISRSGLRALLVASNLLQSKGGRLVITGAHGNIRKFMKSSGFNHLLQLD